METPTVHNSAVKGEIAPVVLMPGDPLRAKYIAEKFLDNAVCFNEVRSMLGFTGTYKGKRISVMGSGMGMPSMGIYSYELYKFYGVEKIIRIGSCGAYDDKLDLLDTILVDSSYSESNFALTFDNSNEHIAKSSDKLNADIEEVANKLKIKLVKGNIFTSDCFDWYIDVEKLLARIPKEYKCIAAEMESYALFTVATKLKKQASCMLTVVDSHTKKTLVSSKDREIALNDMIKIALETAIK